MHGARGAETTAAAVGRITNIRVVDGDSIEARYKGQLARIRLYGIDAPELAQLEGPESAEHLAALVRRSRTLVMEVIDQDHYGRLVGLIYAERSHRRNSLNLRMVREGQAYAYTRFGGAEFGMRPAERDAQAARRGLWRHGTDGGERPWDFRERGRERATKVFGWPFLAILILAVLFMIGLGIAIATGLI